MLKPLLLALVASTAALPNVASADKYVRGAHIGWTVHQPTRFMVTGVLRQDGSSNVIKPIHGIVTAGTSDAAVSAFSTTARQQYPGYTLIATLASPVPAAGACENSI